MASAVSAQDMILLARQATNTETLDEANAFMPDAECLAHLNEELAELYDLIIECSDDDYYRGSQTVTAQPGVTVYALNIPVYKVISVDVVWSSNIRRSAIRFQEAERNRFLGLTVAWTYLADVYYRTNGDNIEIQPTPQAGVTMQINYVPAFVELTTLSSTFDSVNRWHMAAVWGLAATICQKDDNESGAAACLARKASHVARIRALAGSRITGEAPRVERIRGSRVVEDW